MPGTSSARVRVEGPCGRHVGYLKAARLDPCQSYGLNDYLTAKCQGAEEDLFQKAYFFLILGFLNTLFWEGGIRSKFLAQLMSVSHCMWACSYWPRSVAVVSFCLLCSEIGRGMGGDSDPILGQTLRGFWEE